jgi:hypothetical protein
VTHELVHLVIDTATGNPYRGPPRWLHEGLATYLSEGYTTDSRRSVEVAARADELLPLDAMAGQLPTDADKAGLAYAETVSAVDYLVRTYGRDALVDLIRAYEQGLTDDEVFTQAIGVGLAGFQAGKLADCAETRSARPQPAPPGPCPRVGGSGQPPGRRDTRAGAPKTRSAGGSRTEAGAACGMAVVLGSPWRLGAWPAGPSPAHDPGRDPGHPLAVTWPGAARPGS